MNSVLRIQCNNQKSNSIYFVVLYLILMSGSVLQKTYMGGLQKINILVTIIVIVFFLFEKRSAFFRVTLNTINIYIILAGLGIFLNMVVNLDFRSVIGYISDFCIVLIPAFIVKKYKYDDFVDAYINIIITLAFISLVMFYFPIFTEVLPKIVIPTNEYSGGFLFYGVYTKFINSSLSVFNRNCGVFWEPGMYQGFLIIAMVFIATGKKRDHEVLLQILLAVAIISTRSTTGFALLALVGYLYVLKLISGQNKILQIGLTVLVIVFTLIIVLTPEIYLYILGHLPNDVVGKLFDLQNTSRNTRLLNFVVDFKNVISHPLGISRGTIESLRIAQRQHLSLNIDESITTTTLPIMLQQGLIAGLMYLWINVKGCFLLNKNKFLCIVVFFITIIIINTEPHYLGMFFTVVFFYFVCRENENDYKQRGA